MTRNLSRFRGTFSRRKPSVSAANCALKPLAHKRCVMIAGIVEKLFALPVPFCLASPLGLKDKELLGLKGKKSLAQCAAVHEAGSKQVHQNRKSAPDEPRRFFIAFCDLNLVNGKLTFSRVLQKHFSIAITKDQLPDAKLQRKIASRANRNQALIQLT
jgi:hypothetical protein